MTEKKYRTEQIEGATLPFIVDNYSAKKHKTMTGYKAYDTTTVKKCEELTDLLNNYEEEIEQLKSELSRYKEVNRLDIWKSSYSSEDALITELQNKCDKKQEHIVLLENKIHRMREQIKKLEGLYHYRGYTGVSGDVKKEYYRREKLLRAENDQLKEKKEQLKETVNELRDMDKEKDIEIEHINNIYKEFGFKGIIDYAKDKLHDYGIVREVDKGLWLFATGGWSDNEFWLDCLLNWNFMYAKGHYCAMTSGGGYYYSEEPYTDIEVRKREVKG